MSHSDLVYLTDHRVLESLLISENNQIIKSSYFVPSTLCQQQQQQQQHHHQQENHQHQIFQTNFNQDDRRLLGEWMLDVCVVEQCQNDVFPLSMVILDKFLTKVEMKRRQLQLLGAVCLILASKVRQTNQISLKRLRGYTDNLVSIEQLIDWELLVLATLKWDLALVSSIDYLDILIRRPQCMLLIANNYADSIVGYSKNFGNFGNFTSTISKLININMNSSNNNNNYNTYNSHSNTANINHRINQIEAETQRLIYECSLDFSYSLYPASLIACACLKRAVKSVLSTTNSSSSTVTAKNSLPYDARATIQI